MLGERGVFGDEDVGTSSTAVGVSAEYHVASAICGAVVGVGG